MLSLGISGTPHEGDVVFGHCSGSTMRWDTKTQPHLMIKGSAGTGKTTVISDIIYNCLENPEWEVYTIFESKHDLESFRQRESKNSFTHTVTSDQNGALALLKDLRESAHLRQARMKQEQVDSYLDTSFPPRKILLSIDGLDVLNEVSYGKTEIPEEISNILVELAEAGAAAGFHLVTTSYPGKPNEDELYSHFHVQCDLKRVDEPGGRSVRDRASHISSSFINVKETPVVQSPSFTLDKPQCLRVQSATSYEKVYEGEEGIQLGTTKSGRVFWVPESHTNLLIGGNTGAGKTSFLEHIVTECLVGTDDWDVYSIVEHTQELYSFQEHALERSGTASLQDGIDDALALLVALKEKVQARYLLMGKEMVSNYKDLSSPPKRILLTMDEIGYVLYHSQEGNQKFRAAIEIIKELAKVGTATGVHIAMTTHSAIIKHPIHGGLLPLFNALCSISRVSEKDEITGLRRSTVTGSYSPADDPDSVRFFEAKQNFPSRKEADEERELAEKASPPTRSYIPEQEQITLGSSGDKNIFWDTYYYPHIAIQARPGSGKTVLLNNMIDQCLLRPDDWEVYSVGMYSDFLINAMGKVQANTQHRTSQGLEEALVLLSELEETVRARYALMADEMADTYRQLSTAPKEILVTIDSMSSLMEEANESQQNEIIRILTSLANVGSVLGIHLVVASSTSEWSDDRRCATLDSKIEMRCDLGIIGDFPGKIGEGRNYFTGAEDNARVFKVAKPSEY